MIANESQRGDIIKKLLLFLNFIFFLLGLTACQETINYDVVTTLFPQYSFASEILNGKVNVKNLLTPGLEAHDFEPTSRNIIEIQNSKIFINTSQTFDSAWVSNVSIKNKFPLQDFLLTDHLDPHFWTDPVLVREIISGMSFKFGQLFPDKASDFIENANILNLKIISVHEKLKQLLENRNLSIHFAGHTSMESFANRYGLKIVALDESFNPNASITSKQITKVVDSIIYSKAKFVFIEELSNKGVATIIKKEVKLQTGYDLQLLELHGYHNLSFDDASNSISYYDLLVRNYENIRLAVGG